MQIPATLVDAPIIVMPDDPRYGSLLFGLATRLSEVMRIALRDLRKVEAADKLYRVDMGSFHEYDGDADADADEDDGPKCSVCFAGSVMAFSLAAKINKNVNPNDFEPAVERKLLAIDALREGSVVTALNVMYGEDDSNGDYLTPKSEIKTAEWVDRVSNLKNCMTSYENDPDTFKDEIEVLIALMQYKGL